ncbi:MAG: hypothetical protein JW759_03800 [Candidatus Coatesbacteria bacterium]|nr:hypothetical protein [Candidatus Coatesbacteria bacterium]
MVVAGKPKIKERKIQHLLAEFVNTFNEEERETLRTEKIVQKFFEFAKRVDVLESFKKDTEILIAGMSDDGSKPAICGFIIQSDDAVPEIHHNFGVFPLGVSDALDSLFEQGAIKKYPVRDFPLQDAVEFAEFLMETQKGVDRFVNRIPRVGGEIDVAVIDPVRGFGWVKQKHLQRILEDR